MTLEQKEKLQKAKDLITSYRGPRIRIMEVCGTHTHEIFRLGLRQLLPPDITLISGPGCPVCVTPTTFIDEALWLALAADGPQATICTFGDLIRVPGTTASLATARAEGAKIQIVYTPLDAAEYAHAHPEETVVFLSVGFETTVPSSCLALQRAQEYGCTNFTLLTANKVMPPAYQAMASSCDAYLYPGHVCAITGTSVPEQLVSQDISGVVAGFTAAELLTAIAVIVKRVPLGQPFFVNCYPRVVKPAGSPKAMALIDKYMQPVDAEWRGLGIMPASGLALRPDYAASDARKRFRIPPLDGHPNPACRCGEILQGRCTPPECPLFGKTCTIEHPVGACMVSREGTCSAFYQYGNY